MRSIQPPTEKVPGFVTWGKGGGVKLTFDLHVAPRLRMSGCVPVFPQYAFMGRKGGKLSVGRANSVELQE